MESIKTAINSTGKIITAVIIAGIIGAFSLYGSHYTTQEKLSNIEKQVDEMRQDIKDMQKFFYQTSKK